MIGLYQLMINIRISNSDINKLSEKVLYRNNEEEP